MIYHLRKLIKKHYEHTINIDAEKVSSGNKYATLRQVTGDEDNSLSARTVVSFQLFNTNETLELTKQDAYTIYNNLNNLYSFTLRDPADTNNNVITGNINVLSLRLQTPAFTGAEKRGYIFTMLIDAIYNHREIADADVDTGSVLEYE